MRGNERVLHFNVVTAGAAHADDVPIVDDFGVFRGAGDQESFGRAVSAPAQLAIFEYVGVAKIHCRLMCAADKRGSARQEIASLDGNSLARRLLAADGDGVAPGYFARGGVAEPGPEQIVGDGNLQIPARRAVDAA
ncbi:hypothetical protein WOB59_03595 [Methylocystis sp. IM4]|uniref:hypothetical protein n=1 Tax=Methylocystis sp. IM4 TaxID=3136560 RepID=UPI00311A4137